MIGAKSGEGISLSSVMLELAAISTTVAYSVAKSFPFRSEWKRKSVIWTFQEDEDEEEEVEEEEELWQG